MGKRSNKSNDFDSFFFLLSEYMFHSVLIFINISALSWYLRYQIHNTRTYLKGRIQILVSEFGRKGVAKQYVDIDECL